MAMPRLLLVTAALFVYLSCQRHGPFCFADKATSIFIDLVSGYGELAPCAEQPLSTVVRDMQLGCGDDSHLTSYSCFCTDSYMKFGYVISTGVIQACGGTGVTTGGSMGGIAPAQATSAIDVFEKYCDLGVNAVLVAGTGTSWYAKPTETVSSSDATKANLTKMATPISGSLPTDPISTSTSSATSNAHGKFGSLQLSMVACIAVVWFCAVWVR